MKLLLINQSKDRAPRQWMQAWLKGLARQLGRRGHKGWASKEVVIVLVDGREMKRLNRLYRGKDYATDILSFETAEPTSLGEMVICLPTLRAQSKRTGLSERGELGYMLVHGVLHLLGYDHAQAREEAIMFALQDELYRGLEARVGLGSKPLAF